MTFTFDIGIEDVMAFQKNAMDHNRRYKRTKRFSAWFFPVLFIIFALFVQRESMNGKISFLAVYCLIISILWVIFMPRIIDRNNLKKLRKTMSDPANSSFFGKREMSFTENGLMVNTPEGETTLKWKAISNIRENADYFFVYLSQLSAYIVPKKELTASDIENLKALFANNTTYNPYEPKK